MYLAPAADTPSTLPWWQRFILGWYLPASLALIWLSGPVWMNYQRINLRLSRLFNHNISFIEDLVPIKYILLLIVIISVILLFIMNTRAYIKVLISITLILLVHYLFISIIKNDDVLSKEIWRIGTNEIDYYQVKFGYIAVSGLISLVITATEIATNLVIGNSRIHIFLIWMRIFIATIACYTILFGLYQH